MSSHNLTLYSVGTPNGLKISVALALIGLDYKLHPISFAKNEQKEDWFISMNPNGRIPTVVDHQNKDFVIFESGAILLYLADRYDPEGILIAKDKDIKSQVEQWVMWQMGGLGPMLGQLGWFKRQEEKNEMAIKRYLDESMRLLGVLEIQLNKTKYLVGDQLSIADISSFCWVRFADKMELDLTDFPKVQAWIKLIEENPKVQEGLKAHDAK